MFQPAKNGKITTHIVNQFRSRIFKGELKPGQILPPEKDLMVEFGVSKQTLRESLRALEIMGLLQIKRGASGGPVVQPVDLATTRESIMNFLFFENVRVEDLSAVRKIIEPQLVRQLAGTLSAQGKQALVEVHELCKRNYDPAKLKGITDEINFHVFMARQSGNSTLVLILDFVNNLLANLKKAIKPDDVFVEMVQVGHQRIVDSLLADDGEGAANNMLLHLCEVEQALATLAAKAETQATLPR